jgi:hypothetical protein
LISMKASSIMAMLLLSGLSGVSNISTCKSKKE